MGTTIQKRFRENEKIKHEKAVISAALLITKAVRRKLKHNHEKAAALQIQSVARIHQSRRLKAESAEKRKVWAAQVIQRRARIMTEVFEMHKAARVIQRQSILANQTRGLARM